MSFQLAMAMLLMGDDAPPDGAAHKEGILSSSANKDESRERLARDGAQTRGGL